MYNSYFGFKENPFSIAPDPRYLYMSEMHQDGLAHLQFGALTDGCIVLLTGEIGTGKTTLCRCFLEQLDPTAKVAVIINPGLSADELLATVCDEFQISDTIENGSTKQYIDALNQFLLQAHAENLQALLIIDEAQNLDKDALEMVRLLTNLETNQQKLLKIFLLGQSELSTILTSPDLTQVNQRITGRFHLTALKPGDIVDYINHRISIGRGNTESSGVKTRLFSDKALKTIHRLTGGIPRLINTLCDRSLLGAYSEEKKTVDEATVKRAGREIFGHTASSRSIVIPLRTLAAATLSVVLILAVWVGSTNDLFHLNLQSMLSAPTSPTAESSPESLPTTTEEVVEPGRVSLPPAADLQAEVGLTENEEIEERTEIESEGFKTIISDDFKQVVSEEPLVEDQVETDLFANPVMSEAETIPLEQSDTGTAPLKQDSEVETERVTRITIKEIEINK